MIILTKKHLTKFQRIKRDTNLNIQDVPINLISDNPFQPRKRYKGIKELAKNISTRGLLQPIIVAKTGDKYTLVAGHRRIRAFKRLHRKTIPSNVKFEMSPKEMQIDLAVENALRKDLLPIEKAQSYFDLLCHIKNVNGELIKAYAIISQVKLNNRRGDSTEYNTKGNTIGFTMEDIYQCKKLLRVIDVSPNHVITHLRLLSLPKSIQGKIVMITDNHSQQTEALDRGEIPINMGYELSRINNKTIQLDMYNKIVKKKLKTVVVRGIVDQMLEENVVEQYNKLGSSRRKNTNDYGLNDLIDNINTFASTLWNFRNKYPKINIALDKLFFKSALRRLKKGCEGLIESMDPYFNDDEDWEIKKFEDKKIELIVRPGSGGQKFRFSFPGKYGQSLGLDTGDTIVFKIDSIKKRNKNKASPTLRGEALSNHQKTETAINNQ